MSERRTDDATLISALQTLSLTIQTDDGVIGACLAEAAARLEALVEERRWIPVGERLPERHVVVDVHARGAHPAERWTGVAYRGVTIKGEEWCDTAHGLPLSEATGLEIEVAYWMPLPPGPEVSNG